MKEAIQTLYGYGFLVFIITLIVKALRKGGESQNKKGKVYRRVVYSFIGVSNFIEGGKQCLGNF